MFIVVAYQTEARMIFRPFLFFYPPAVCPQRHPITVRQHQFLLSLALLFLIWVILNHRHLLLSTIFFFSGKRETIQRWIWCVTCESSHMSHAPLLSWHLSIACGVAAQRALSYTFGARYEHFPKVHNPWKLHLRKYPQCIADSFAIQV